MRWILKATLQGVISRLPKSRQINYLFQKYASRGVYLTESEFDARVDFFRQHLQDYQRFFPDQIPLNALEVGTGWLPVVTIGLSLCGVAKIYSVDIDPLLRADRLASTIDLWIRAADDGRIADLPIDSHRLAVAREVHSALTERRLSAVEAMSQLNIELLVTDARKLAIEPQSIHYFFSTVTFEHIPGEVLQGILNEFHRVADPSAVMSHLIDMSDHYSHFDRTLTPYHFLRFTNFAWKFFNNALLYQNRLRISDYRAFHERAGFEIVSEDNTIGSPQQIAQMRLAPMFAAYAHEDVIVTSSMMVSRPKATQRG